MPCRTTATRHDPRCSGRAYPVHHPLPPRIPLSLLPLPALIAPRMGASTYTWSPPPDPAKERRARVPPAARRTPSTEAKTGRPAERRVTRQRAPARNRPVDAPRARHACPRRGTGHGRASRGAASDGPRRHRTNVRGAWRVASFLPPTPQPGTFIWRRHLLASPSKSLSRLAICQTLEKKRGRNI